MKPVILLKGVGLFCHIPRSMSRVDWVFSVSQLGVLLAGASVLVCVLPLCSPAIVVVA